MVLLMADLGRTGHVKSRSNCVWIGQSGCDDLDQFTHRPLIMHLSLWNMLLMIDANKYRERSVGEKYESYFGMFVSIGIMFGYFRLAARSTLIVQYNSKYNSNASPQ
jgi:hypothetical protein